ncbi:hypothetical protein V502_10045 [Pseudogymnoascus sp. VKM F-4520 (FW-2644)]|nr:hypothetical protein V502_10045 [Pseudogymnoascus sp. VKM F-4520 (FW-2644)]
MLLSQLLPLALVTLAVAEKAQIIFYGEIYYQDYRGVDILGFPDAQNKCIYVKYYLGGVPAKSARISSGSVCHLYKDEQCGGDAATILTEDTKVIPYMQWGHSVRCTFPVA